MRYVDHDSIGLGVRGIVRGIHMCMSRLETDMLFAPEKSMALLLCITHRKVTTIIISYPPHFPLQIAHSLNISTGIILVLYSRC